MLPYKTKQKKHKISTYNILNYNYDLRAYSTRPILNWDVRNEEINQR